MNKILNNIILNVFLQNMYSEYTKSANQMRDKTFLMFTEFYCMNSSKRYGWTESKQCSNNNDHLLKNR